MSSRIDAATLLSRALVADAERSGVAARVVTATAQRWASATFVGARHRLVIEGEACAAVDPWLTALPDADLPVRRHLVADLVVVDQAQAGDGFTATLEILTVEEA